VRGSELPWKRERLAARLKGLKVVVENRKILAGLSMLMGIILASEIGYRLSPYDPKVMGNVPLGLPPSWEHPLGTDPMGRDLLTQLLYGATLSIRIGFIAGMIAFAIAVLIALIGGYYGGTLDGILNVVTEVFITIPSLAILILVAALVGRVTIPLMALILAVFSWAWPCKVMRAQILSLKERGFIRLAKLSGYHGIEIVIREIMPNMLPFLGAYFAVVVSWAMIAQAGLELIGLGPQYTITLGIMLNWAMVHAAFTRGLVNWWIPPVIVLIWVFLSLFIISMGLDEIGNPRLKVKG